MDITTWLKTKKIGVLYGGRSAERAISLQSGNAVLKALKGIGADAAAIDAGPDLPFQLKRHGIDFAFIALHGPWGEDGTVQGLLEIMNIPYSGCGILSSALSMNKIYTKEILGFSRLPTPPWQVVTRGAGTPSWSHFPLVVKPSTQGSAIGVSVVRAAGDMPRALEQALALDARIIVEDYVKGTEITVGVLGQTPLPVVEIVPANDFYDYESKYQAGKSNHVIPARVPEPVLREVRDLALKVFRALDCRAVARIDMIVDEKDAPWVLEVNTIPGMTETSLLPDAARAAGMSFAELVVKIIEYSLDRQASLS